MNRYHKDAHEIPGNVEADELAGQAAQDGRDVKYVHPEMGIFDMTVHDTIMHEVASLVFDVQNKFPRKKGTVALQPREVAPRDTKAR